MLLDYDRAEEEECFVFVSQLTEVQRYRLLLRIAALHASDSTPKLCTRCLACRSGQRDELQCLRYWFLERSNCLQRHLDPGERSAAAAADSVKAHAVENAVAAGPLQPSAAAAAAASQTVADGAACGNGWKECTRPDDQRGTRDDPTSTALPPPNNGGPALNNSDAALNNSYAALRHSGTEEMTGAGEMREVQEEGSEEVEAGEKRGGDGRPEELRNEEREGAQERVGSAGGRPAEVEAGSSSSSSSRSSAQQLRGAGDSEMREVQEGSEEVEAGLRAQASAASFVSAMPCSSSAREAGAEDMRGGVKVEQRCESETQSAMLKARRRVASLQTAYRPMELALQHAATLANDTSLDALFEDLGKLSDLLTSLQEAQEALRKGVQDMSRANETQLDTRKLDAECKAAAEAQGLTGRMLLLQEPYVNVRGRYQNAVEALLLSDNTDMQGWQASDLLFEQKEHLESTLRTHAMRLCAACKQAFNIR